MTATVVAVVGLGGNLGDSARVLRDAIGALGASPGIRSAAASALYRTRAWGVEAQPDFVNAAVAVETTRPARDLLDTLLGIERAFGRVRAADGSDRWGPRTLDLDLLLYGERVFDEPGLRVPHPHLHQRAFALVPLLEVRPDAWIPGIGSARDALAALGKDAQAGLVPLQAPARQPRRPA